ncbi:MAG: fibronectin type III domain-containing protein [bacterium]
MKVEGSMSGLSNFLETPNSIRVITMHKSSWLMAILSPAIFFSFIFGCGKEDRDDLISPDTTKPKVSNVLAAPERTTAQISWLTDEPATSRVEYGLTLNPTTLQSEDDSLLTHHNIHLSNLTPETTYFYRVRSRDSNHNWNEGDEVFIFTTRSADDRPPVITNVRALPEARCVTIKWDTDEPATSQVDYGRTNQYSSSTPFEADLVREHSIRFCGLSSQTTYYYRVKSEDAAGNLATSEAELTFTTAEEKCPIAPVISNVVITPGPTSATISWQTNVPTTAQIAYGQTTGYGSLTTKQTTLKTSHSVTLTGLSQGRGGLSQGRGYHFKIISEDVCGNQATPSDGVADRTFTTSEEECPVPPVISNVSVTPETDSAIIAWKTNVPTIGQVSYGQTSAYGSSTPKETTFSQTHTVTLTGLTPGSEYHFRISSEDKCGNKATPTDSITDRTFRTKEGGKCLTPPTISSVASEADGTRITITWTSNVLTTSQIEYGLSSNYGQETEEDTLLTIDHHVELPPLESETTYHYQVLSKDECGTLATPKDGITDRTFTTGEGKLGLGILPTAAVVKVGKEFPLEVWIENVTDLFGAAYKLKYETQRLELVEAGPDSFLGDEKEVIFFQSGTNGILDIANSKKSGAQGATGSGVITVFKFKGLKPGTTTISHVPDKVVLRDSAGGPLGDMGNITLRNATITIIP